METPLRDHKGGLRILTTGDQIETEKRCEKQHSDPG